MKNLMNVEADVICTRCGLVNDYKTVRNGNHLSAYCNSCNAYIKHLPQGKPMIFYFGKYKGRELASLVEKDELAYLQWAYRNILTLTPHQKTQILEHLKQYNLGI